VLTDTWIERPENFARNRGVPALTEVRIHRVPYAQLKLACASIRTHKDANALTIPIT
jgi:hypothetical protein